MENLAPSSKKTAAGRPFEVFFFFFRCGLRHAQAFNLPKIGYNHLREVMDFPLGFLVGGWTTTQVKNIIYSQIGSFPQFFGVNMTQNIWNHLFHHLYDNTTRGNERGIFTTAQYLKPPPRHHLLDYSISVSSSWASPRFLNGPPVVKSHQRSWQPSPMLYPHASREEKCEENVKQYK